MKMMIVGMMIVVIASLALADDLFFLIKKSDWDALSTGQKNAGKAVLSACVDSSVEEVLGWNWSLRNKSNTNEVWGCANYAGGAWVLKRGASKVNDVLIGQVRSQWGCIADWTTDFWNSVDTNGLERIPVDEP